MRNVAFSFETSEGKEEEREQVVVEEEEALRRRVIMLRVDIWVMGAAA